MDPISIALSLLLKDPSAAASAMQNAMAPGVVDVSRMQSSVADLARGVLKCYHKTARFHSVDVAQGRWSRQGQYGADNSLVMQIRFSGLTAMPYTMVVAVMAKEDKVRTAVLADNAIVPYARKCQLEEWTGV